jgi:hypothetical protein
MKLTELGIRYVRDRALPGVYVRANDLYKSLEIKTLMITERYKSGSDQCIFDPTQINAELNEMKVQALLETVSLEGPNEYNLEHGPDPNWIENFRNYTIVLYKTVNADEMLKKLSVIAPSLTSLESHDLVGDLDQYIEYTNLHMYFGNGWPSFSR